MRRVLVDCDVILDLLLARKPFLSAATRLFELFESNKLKGHVSSLAFSNLFYVLRRQIEPAAARDALRKLRNLLRPLPVDEKVVDMSLASSFADLEDALHYYTALNQGMDALVTRNGRHYKSAQIPILGPEECVALLSGSGEKP